MKGYSDLIIISIITESRKPTNTYDTMTCDTSSTHTFQVDKELAIHKEETVSIFILFSTKITYRELPLTKSNWSKS